MTRWKRGFSALRLVICTSRARRELVGTPECRSRRLCKVPWTESVPLPVFQFGGYCRFQTQNGEWYQRVFRSLFLPITDHWCACGRQTQLICDLQGASSECRWVILCYPSSCRPRNDTLQLHEYIIGEGGRDFERATSSFIRRSFH